jgi:hypothetical protein
MVISYIWASYIYIYIYIYIDIYNEMKSDVGFNPITSPLPYGNIVTIYVLLSSTSAFSLYIFTTYIYIYIYMRCPLKQKYSMHDPMCTVMIMT